MFEPISKYKAASEQLGRDNRTSVDLLILPSSASPQFPNAGAFLTQFLSSISLSTHLQAASAQVARSSECWSKQPSPHSHICIIVVEQRDVENSAV